MRNFICMLALGASALSVQASTVLPLAFPSSDPNFIATLDLGLGTLKLSTPFGPDTLAVYDDVPTFLGTVFMTDGGTPGSLLLSIDSTVTQALLLTFDTTGAQLVGSDLFIKVLGAPLTAITDPALALLVGTWNYSFAFAEGITATADGPLVFNFSRASSDVPEPSVASAIGIGLLAISAFRLRKKNAQ